MNNTTEQPSDEGYGCGNADGSGVTDCTDHGDGFASGYGYGDGRGYGDDAGVPDCTGYGYGIGDGNGDSDMNYLLKYSSQFKKSNRIDTIYLKNIEFIYYSIERIQ